MDEDPRATRRMRRSLVKKETGEIKVKGYSDAVRSILRKVKRSPPKALNKFHHRQVVSDPLLNGNQPQVVIVPLQNMTALSTSEKSSGEFQETFTDSSDSHQPSASEHSHESVTGAKPESNESGGTLQSLKLPELVESDAPSNEAASASGEKSANLVKSAQNNSDSQFQESSIGKLEVTSPKQKVVSDSLLNGNHPQVVSVPLQNTTALSTSEKSSGECQEISTDSSDSHQPSASEHSHESVTGAKPEISTDSSGSHPSSASEQSDGSVTGAKPEFKCDVCGLVCKTPYGLSRHADTHKVTGKEKKLNSKQPGTKKCCTSCGKVMLSKNMWRHDCSKKAAAKKRVSEDNGDESEPKKLKKEVAHDEPNRTAVTGKQSGKRQYLRCLTINKKSIKPLVRRDSWQDFITLLKINSYRLADDSDSSDSGEESVVEDDYDAEPTLAERDLATVRRQIGEIPVLPVEGTKAFACVEKFVSQKILPASKPQTLANISRMLGIMYHLSKENNEESDLFEVSLNIDHFEEAIAKLEKAGAMPSTIIKNVGDYRLVPTAFEVRFDDEGVPNDDLFSKKIKRIKSTMETVTRKYEKKNVVIIEEHKRKIAAQAEKVDIGAVFTFKSDPEVTKDVRLALEELQNTENLDSARHAQRPDVLNKVHLVSCYISSALVTSGTRPVGLQRFTNVMFDRAEYDVAEKLYHFRLTDQKTSGVGGAAPLAVDENLMQIMNQYYDVKQKVFPNAKQFLLNNQGHPLTYTQVFQNINKYLTRKGLPPISTSILRVAYETASHNSLNEEERKLVSSVLAHSSTQVVQKHYVADTIEGQSRAQMALRKTQGILLLKHDITNNPEFYGSALTEKDVVAKFIRKSEEHKIYEPLLLPVQAQVINIIRQIRNKQQTS